jgi:2-phospho-L-lactate guanylyltransferase
MPHPQPPFTPFAVVPVKNIEQAKQRLAGLLDPARRQGLYRAMLEDVLAALAASRLLSGTLVVTRDPWAMELAARRGFEVLEEARNEGHTQASTRGARALAARGAAGMLQVPGDLPLLRGQDVDALIAAHAPGRAVTVAPSRDRQGSNGVLCSPPDLLPLRFGEDSFIPHLARSLALGVQPRVLECAGFAFDVDTPEDLRAALEQARVQPMGRNTAHYLEHAGVLERLRGSTRADPA